PSGTVAAFGYAQVIYTLPVSLFGMAVSAASLPSMSADAGAKDKLHGQLESGLRTIAFPVVHSVAAFLALGDVICAALFQTGRFEFWLLRRGIGLRIGEVHVTSGLLPRLWAAAALATAIALAAKSAALRVELLARPIPLAIIVLGLFGATYLGATVAMGIPEA